MFGSSPAFSTFAVPDIDVARRFYADTLGLQVRGPDEMGLIELHLGSGARVSIYPKPDHRPAVFTVLNFPVPDIGRAVDELTSKGVDMETYALDGLERDDKGIYRGEGPAIAWFTDPAGNILSVIETPQAEA